MWKSSKINKEHLVTEVFRNGTSSNSLNNVLKWNDDRAHPQGDNGGMP